MDKKQQEAAEKAKLAAKQMSHAARNATDAAEAAAGFAKDEVLDGTAEAKSRVQEIAKRMVYSEAGRGVLAIGLGLLSISIGVKKLQTANQIGKNVRATMDKVE